MPYPTRILVLPGPPRTLAPIQYHNFAPRIGFAYSPDNAEGWLGNFSADRENPVFASGTASFSAPLRMPPGLVEVGDAPFGIYYAAPPNTQLATPFYDRATGNNEGQKFPFTFPAANVSPKNPDTTFNWVQATPISGSDYLNPRDKIPNVQEFEFSLQRQLGASTVISTSYVGSVGRHLLTFEDANPANAAPLSHLE